MSTNQLDNPIDVITSLDKSPEFYRHFASLFTPYYHLNDDDRIKDLNDSGYLLYQCVMQLDRIIDDQDVDRSPFMLSLFEMSLEKLHQIFPLKSDFWRLWRERKYFFFQAIDYEKNINHDSALWSDYCEISVKKAGLGALAIDALHYIADDKNWKIHNSLFNSYSNFSIAYQLLDDVLDVNEDLKKNQFNWLLYQCRKKGIYHLDTFQISPDLKIEVLQLSKYHFNKAKSFLPKHNVSVDNFELAIDCLSQNVTNVIDSYGRACDWK
ncbi:MAG: hypothetical protein MJ010_08675 [Paludibacteraceae bacterium]|nr:hypothetical protein [Paludibacteraceae bacterium]